MSKVWKLLVVGIITALTGIILFSCSASAAEFVQVRVSKNPSGVILNTDLSAKDPKSGFTGFELIRNSIYEDISYAMDLWLNSVEKNTAGMNNTWGTSIVYEAIATDAERKGVLPMSPSSTNARTKPTVSVKTEKSVVNVSAYLRSYPSLSMPSLAWASYFASSDLFSGGSTDIKNTTASGITLGKAQSTKNDSESRYLVFTSGNTVYSYPLCDAVYTSNRADKDAFVQIMQVALFDAFTPYASVVYSYNLSTDSLTQFSNISRNDASSYVPAYIIHPLAGIIPCNANYNSATSGSDKVQVAGQLLNRADYFQIYYGYKYNANANGADLGLSNILGDCTSPSGSRTDAYNIKEHGTVTRAIATENLIKLYVKLTSKLLASNASTTDVGERDLIYAPMYSLFSMFGTDNSSNRSSASSGFTHLINYVTDDINCYMWNVMFVKDAFRSGKTDLSSIHSFLLSPDYVTWIYKSRSSDRDSNMQGFTQIDANKSGVKTVLSTLSMAKMKSSAAQLSPSCYLCSLAAVSSISEWKPTSVYGVYTNELNTSSKLSRLLTAIADTGYYDTTLIEASEDYVNAGYAYKFIQGSSKGNYLSDSFETITISEGNTIEITKNVFNTAYYVDLSTGTMYKTTDSTLPALMAVSGYEYRTDLSYYGGKIVDTLASQSLLIKLVEVPDSQSQGYYVTSAFGSSLRRYYFDILYSTAASYMTPSSKMCNSNVIIPIAIPSAYAECIKDVWTTKSTSMGKTETYNTIFYIGTGRELSFNLSNASSVDLLNDNGIVKFSNTDTAASGAFYNSSGRISTANPSNITYEFVMLSDTPAIVLGSSYIQDSSVLNWLETSSASSYMSQYVSQTGYTADLLYKRLTSKGITLNGGATADDYARYADISLELSGDMSSGIIQTVLTAISFVGLLLMVYACVLVIAFYIDIFNTVTATSILSIITFGACKAVQSKQDLEEMGITDPKERKKYCTRVTILFRWAGAMLIGIIFFASSKVYTLILQLYNWLMQLF